MQVSDERCEAFRQLCQAEFGVALTLDEARASLSSVLALMERYVTWYTKTHGPRQQRLSARRVGNSS